MKKKAIITGFATLAVTATFLPAQSGGEEVVELEETALQSEGTEAPETELIANESSSASKFDIPIAETPRSVSVVTEEEMEFRGVKTIEEALFYTPGVYAGAYGVDTRGDWAKVRGVMPQDYRDGLKSMFGFYNNTRPHPYTLERVEVVKGPASFLYGQSSIGGILNVETKRARLGTLREVFIEYGTDEWKQIGFDFNDAIDPQEKFLFRLVGVYRDADTMVDHVENDAIVFTPSFSWRPTEDTIFTLIANYQENDSGPSTQFLPLEGTLLPGRDIPPETFIGEPGWDNYDTQQGSLTGLFEHQINDIWSVEAKARYTDSEADYRAHWVAYDPVPTINPDGTVTRTIYASDHTADVYVGDVRMKADFATGIVEHKVAFGVDYQNATTDNDTFYGWKAGGDINIYDPVYGNLKSIGPQKGPETKTTQLGVYVGDHLEVNEWIFSAGLRADRAKSDVEGRPSMEDDEISADLGAMYRFHNGIHPYVSYAESFEPIAGTDASGDAFDPKEGRQYEVGVKYQPRGWNSLFTVAVFDIEESNRPTAAPGGTGQVQTGEVGIQGVEFGVQQYWNDFYVQLGYTYLDTEVTESNNADEKGSNLPSVPDHLASAWVGYRPETGFRFGTGVRYVGNTWDGTDTHETPSYTLVDAMIGYDFGDFELALNATNLLDKEYITSSESSTAYYGQPRRLILSARYEF